MKTPEQITARLEELKKNLAAVEAQQQECVKQIILHRGAILALEEALAPAPEPPAES